MFTIIVTIHKGEDSYTVEASGRNSRKVTKEVGTALDEMLHLPTVVKTQYSEQDSTAWNKNSS